MQIVYLSFELVWRRRKLCQAQLEYGASQQNNYPLASTAIYTVVSGLRLKNLMIPLKTFSATSTKPYFFLITEAARRFSVSSVTRRACAWMLVPITVPLMVHG